MKPRQVFVYGAGGHGKVVADILLANGKENLVGFVDDRKEIHGTEVLGLPVLGDREWLRKRAQGSPIAVALGVGNNRSRQHVGSLCEAWGIETLTVIHPSAIIAPSAELGRGTVVMAGAAVNPDARTGRGAIVNTGAIVEHDVVIGDFAHVAPNAAMGGASRLGALSQLGLGAVVIQYIEIGCCTIIGAGAVVVRPIPNGVVAFGVPARIQSRIDA